MAPGPRVGQADLAALVRHRCLAGEHLAHDLDVVLDAPVGLAPGLAVPALDDLRARYAEPGDEAYAAGERIDGRCRHGTVGGRARGKLHDGRAELDAAGLAGEEGERRHRIRAVGLGRPHGIVAQLLGPLHQLDGDVERGARVSQMQPELHGVPPFLVEGIKAPAEARGNRRKRGAMLPRDDADLRSRRWTSLFRRRSEPSHLVFAEDLLAALVALLGLERKVAMGRASRRLRPIGSPVSSQKP